MINIDHETAQTGTEPLLTLYTYRRAKGRILFGRHMSSNIQQQQQQQQYPVLSVGSRVSVMMASGYSAPQA